jgi:hypothetical protein
VAREDWYRSTDWDDGIAAAFEARLRRTRTRAGRAQYLRIQGLTLAEARIARLVAPARALLRRVLDEHPDVEMEVAGAHRALGESLAREGRFAEAVAHFRAGLAVERAARAEGCDFSWTLELLLAEAVVAADEREAFGEALEALDAMGRRGLAAPDVVWRGQVALTRMRARSGDPRAAESAAFALGVAARLQEMAASGSAFPAAAIDGAVLDELRRIAAA